MVRKLMKSISKLVGLSTYDIFLFKAMKHHEWLYRSKIKIPRGKFVFTPVLKNTSEDIELCERLIAAYKKSMKDFSSTHDLSELWKRIIQSKFSRLIKDLEKGDPNILAGTLAEMFQSDFVHGIAPGDLYKGLYKERVGLRIWSLKLLDDIVSLAEYLGVVRTECSEQGVIGYAFNDGIGKLVSRMEKVLKMSMDFPKTGAPYGLKINDSLITMESPEHIYVALRINELINRNLENLSEPRILEIGAGFGGTAFWLLCTRNLAVKSYTIIDLPHVNVLQGYFLAKVFGAKNVSLYGEARDIHQPVISVMPTIAISSYNNINLLINQDSMPEMPENVVKNYIAWARKNINGYFYSYNQEAYSPVNNIPQVLVPEIVAQTGGFKRLSRNYSWMHRGYVEEVYLNTNAQ